VQVSAVNPFRLLVIFSFRISRGERSERFRENLKRYGFSYCNGSRAGEIDDDGSYAAVLLQLFLSNILTHFRLL